MMEPPCVMVRLSDLRAWLVRVESCHISHQLLDRWHVTACQKRGDELSNLKAVALDGCKYHLVVLCARLNVCGDYHPAQSLRLRFKATVTTANPI